MSYLSQHAVRLRCKKEKRDKQVWRSAADEMFYLFVKLVHAVKLLSSTTVPADVLVTDQAQFFIIVL